MGEHPLAEWLKGRTPTFRPVPHCRDDSIEWYWYDEDCYADPVVFEGREVGAVMRSMTTNIPCGVKIHGVKSLGESAD